MKPEQAKPPKPKPATQSAPSPELFAAAYEELIAPLAARVRAQQEQEKKAA